MSDSTPAVDRATLLRDKAIARRAKRDNRMSSATLLAHLVEFVESGSALMDNVETLWKGTPKITACVSRYEKVLEDYPSLALDVAVIEDRGGCSFVRMSEASAVLAEVTAAATS